jgi:hypothetical protein
MSFTPEQAPENTEESLREYLNRMFTNIGITFSQPSKFPKRKEMPYKPQIGDIHYFGDPADHNYDAAITAEGFWGMTSDGWVKLSGSIGGGLITGEYRFNTSTSTGPSSGRIRFDTGVYSTVTELFISDTTSNGGDATNFLTALAADDLIYIQNTGDAGVFSVWTVSGAITDEGNWFRIPVTERANGVFPGNNDKLTTALSYNV